MSTFNRTGVPIVPITGGTAVHGLDDRAMHTGTLSEQYIQFNTVLGHHHDGSDSARVSHSDLLNIGVKTHAEIDIHINKALAVPQTEKSFTTISASYYQIASPIPIFVGRAGNTAASVVALIGEDVTTGISGQPITVIDITTDQEGQNSVVGTGYVLHPYIQFSEAIPNLQIRVRYGVEMTLDTLPESVLINEPLWIAETDQNVRAWITEIKGIAFDRLILPTDNLFGLRASIDSLSGIVTSVGQSLGNTIGTVSGLNGVVSTLDGTVSGLVTVTGALNNRVNALETSVGSGLVKEFGIAPEYSNMVFDNTGILNSAGAWLGGFESSGQVFHTFLSWSTSLSDEQSYRIKLAIKLPSDFGSWDSVTPLRIWRKSEGNLSSVNLHVTLHDMANTVTNINRVAIANTVAGAWEQVLLPALTPSVFNFPANGWVCLTLEASARDIGNIIKLGRIDFSYITA